MQTCKIFTLYKFKNRFEVNYVFNLDLNFKYYNSISPKIRIEDRKEFAMWTDDIELNYKNNFESE